ncbi:hypothetical protein Enr13x_61260 [Stieleria neptunia]|uniref:DUF4347 domain-containing protein n=1 Tax=Stieleria neptunia TaxID=2527979 RepID=A0A518HZJ6_9BACT|nr:DUF4347 domain-containing protein [Stieleria neptunia]QDV46217.1 hypothetical protein Enr13x_61260 [Stieleria neptunia]
MPWLRRKRKNDSSSTGRGSHLLDASVLEKRLLLSATPIDQAGTEMDAEEPVAIDVTSSDTVTDAGRGNPSDSQSQQTRRLELVFVDAGVEDYEQLLDDLRSESGNADLEIYLLDSSRDGVEQVGEILSGYRDVDAVHFVSHGTEGQFQLGNTWLSIDNLDGHAGAIASWNASLRDGADLLIYGCDLAATDDGRALAEALATLCDVDVAASDDDTGHRILGGDWDLEFSTGAIETSLAFSLDVQQNWGHLLNVTVGNTAVFTTPSFTGSDSTSFDVGAGTDQLLLVSVSFGEDKGNEVSNITFNGVGLTKIGSRQDADKARVEIWALVNPASGNQTLNVTYSGTAHEGAAVGLMSFNDVDQSTPLGAFASAKGDSTSQSVTVATAPTDIVFGVLAYSDSNDYEFTADTGIERWETFVGKTNATASTQSVAGTLSVNAQWSTSNNSTWAAAGISIKSATVSGAPSISGLAGDTLNYNEDDSATVIEQGGNVVVTDGDSTDFNGGVLHVSITSGGDSGEDFLGIRDQGTGVGQIGISGSDVTYNFGAGAVTIGTFSGGSGGNDLIVSLSSNADGEAAEALIENITYFNSDTANPTTSARNVRFQLYDGAGGVSGTHDTTVNVARINDAPTASNKTVSTDEDSVYTFSASDFNFSDVDIGDSLTQIKIKSLESVGTLKLSMFDVTDEQVISVGQIPNLTFTPVSQNHGNPYDSFTFQVYDGTEYSAATYTMTIDVDPKADTPTFNGPTNTDEDVLSNGFQLQRNAADGTEVTHFKISGITNGTLYKNDGVTVISNNSFITYAEGNAGVKFKGSTNYNGSAGFNFQASATGNNSDLSTMVTAGLTIDPVNDAPVLGNNRLVISQGGSVVLSSNELSATDVDHSNAGLTFTVSSVTGGGFERVSAPGVPVFTFTQSEITAGDIQFIHDNGVAGPSYDVDVSDGSATSGLDAASITFMREAVWLSTKGDVIGSGTLGITNWDKDTLLEVSDPSFSLEPGVTNGSFSSAFDLVNHFGASIDVELTGLHVVSRSISVGAPGNTISLQEGDVLFSVNGAQPTLTSTNSLTINKSDIVRFRPDTPGNYSVGTFEIVLDDPLLGDTNIGGFSLVEENMTVGGQLLTAGDFLLVETKGTDNVIHYFDVTSAGNTTTSGTPTLFVDGADLGIGVADFTSVHLLADTVTVGGASLTQGQVLVSLDSIVASGFAGMAGAVNPQDVVALTVTTAGTNTVATGTLLFEGADIKLDSGAESIDAFSLVSVANGAAANASPTISNLTGDTLNFTEGDSATVIEQGTNVTVGDADSADFGTGNLTVSIFAGGDAGEDVLAVRNQGAGVGNISISGSDVRYDFGGGPVVIGTVTGGTAGADLVVTFNANATATAADALIENITYRNTDTDNPSTSARTVRFTLNDGDGGASATHDTTVNVATLNDAPTVSNLAGDSFAYLPGSGPLVIEHGGDAAVADVDSADFNSGNLTVSIAAGNDASEDVLAIRNQGTSTGQISVTGSNVFYNFGAGSVLIGTWAGGSGGADLVVTLNASADATATSALVRNITYENTDTVAATTGTRTIRFTVDDGDGAVSLNHDTMVSVVQGAPGGVVSGLTLWLRADAGVTIGLGGVSQWENQVANATLSELQQALSTQRPDLIASGLNFNPIISFDGINDHLADFSVLGSDLFGTDSASLFLAGSTNGSNGVMLQWIDTLSNRVNLEDDIRFDFGDLNDDQLTAVSPSAGYHIINAQATPGAPAGLSINIDGRQTASGNASVGTPLDNTQFGQFFLGEYPGGGFNDDLDVGEVVIYSTDLSATDRLKVDSYLAIKYGLTLDQTSGTNYLDSTGTVVWSAATNAGYDNDIAGIGQDNGSILAQGQSRSNNVDAIVTMSGASNQDDREFLMWGNDDGALGEVTGEPAGIADRLARIWRVDETGDVGTTTISFDLSGLTYTGTTAADFNLIIDGDADFSSGATLVTATGYNAGSEIVTFTGVDLADGNYFSLGTSLTVNAAPTIGNLAGDTLSYTEDDAATVVEQGTSVTVSDGDSADFDTGNLTVSIFAGGDTAEDILAIRDQGPGVGNITVSGSNVLYDFGGGPVAIGTFTGGSAGADLVVTFNANATAAAADALIENITYQNTDTTNPTTSARTIRFTLNDGDGGTSTAHDATVSVAAQNDVPIIDNLAGDTLGYTEGDAATVIEQGTNVTVSDVDSADFDTGNLTVSVFAGGDTAEDVLAIRDQGAGVGNITVSGSNVLYDFGGGPVVIGTFTGGSAGADLVVTFNASATATAADALIENVTYQNTDAINPTTSARTIRFTLNDGDGGTNVAHDATVNLVTLNDAPTMDLDANDSSGATGADYNATFTEAGGAVAISDAADAIISDIDSPNLTQLTVTITNLLDGANETLTADTSGTSITAVYAAGTLTLSGTDTVANYQQVLRTIAYNNASANPDATTRLIQFVTTDGGSNSNVATADVAIVTVNDTPTAADDNYVTQTGKTLTIGAGGLLANDIDLDGNPLTVIPVSGPITGTLTLGADGSFQFTPAANFTGSVTFTYAVTDGIATSAPTTVTIVVAKPNDLSEVTPGDLLSADPGPEPEPETLPEPPAEEEDAETDDESETLAAITPDRVPEGDVPLVLTGGAVIQTTDDEILTLSMMPTNMPDLTDAADESERIANLSDSHSGQIGRQARSGSNRPSVSILGIARFDSKLLWGDMENLQDDIKQSDIAPYYFAGTFAGFSGALSVGYVMWTVRGGLLATSLLAHLPAWSFVDPLLVLNELEDDDDTDDDSLEEMLDKTENERQSDSPIETEAQSVVQSVIQSTASGETVR